MTILRFKKQLRQLEVDWEESATILITDQMQASNFFKQNIS